MRLPRPTGQGQLSTPQRTPPCEARVVVVLLEVATSSLWDRLGRRCQCVGWAKGKLLGDIFGELLQEACDDRGSIAGVGIENA